jgi:hypothetical protein
LILERAALCPEIAPPLLAFFVGLRRTLFTVDLAPREVERAAFRASFLIFILGAIICCSFLCCLSGRRPLCPVRLLFFLFLSSIYQRGLAFLARERWVMDEATNRRVSRMIVKVSRVAITRIRAFEAGVAMSSSGLQISLAVRSSSKPR